MKYFIIAGEASGDLHGSNLIDALKHYDSKAEFMFWGGDKMADASGISPAKHISDLAIMGFIEVIINLGKIKKNFNQCKSQISDYKPDAVIFIDFPGFNLRISPFVRKLGISTYYYISPKVWAWKKKRVYKIIKSIDVLYSILPFEVEFYKQFNYPIKYIGNPLMDEIDKFKKENPAISKPKKLIAMLPGSRDQELQRMLPIMIDVADKIENYDFIIAGAPNFDKSYYESFFKKRHYKIEFNKTYSILSEAESAMVTSGTATLETALFNVPQVVCYKANSISYVIAKNLVKIKYISLVNLILNKAAIVELIQYDMNPTQLHQELINTLEGGKKRKQILTDYSILQELVGGPGASKRAAEDIFNRESEKQ
ncbi:MAG: lipid-A-disaccharide synthase [Bacteroidetes bacterium]|nr:MAG: lipid-A-disaccharide synthase [Bacteroidota bacterium]